MEKKEKNKVLFIIILIVIALLFFVFLKNNIKNTKPIVINENIIIDTQKEESQKENIN
jgi:dipeptide/tripeptide permease